MADEKKTFPDQNAIGIRKMTKNRGKTPTHHCKNCDKNRYNPCGCIISEKNKEKENDNA